MKIMIGGLLVRVLFIGGSEIWRALIARLVTQFVQLANSLMDQGHKSLALHLSTSLCTKSGDNFQVFCATQPPGVAKKSCVLIENDGRNAKMNTNVGCSMS